MNIKQMGDFAELFGAEVGKKLKEIETKLMIRIDGMQAKLDKCMTYAGEFQSALDYAPGSLVRRNGEMYVAVKHIKAGTAFTAREGSGWERVI